MRVVKSEVYQAWIDGLPGSKRGRATSVFDASGSLDPWQPGDYRNLNGGKCLKLKIDVGPGLPGVLRPKRRSPALLLGGGSKGPRAKDIAKGS